MKRVMHGKSITTSCRRQKTDNDLFPLSGNLLLPSRARRSCHSLARIHLSSVIVFRHVFELAPAFCCSSCTLQFEAALLFSGPVQYDAAVDPTIAAAKIKEPSDVAGQANVCIFPDLNTGNNTYKVRRMVGTGSWDCQCAAVVILHASAVCMSCVSTSTSEHGAMNLQQ